MFASSTKTHPIESQVPSEWFDLRKINETEPIKVEIVVEHQNVDKVENAANTNSGNVHRATGFGNVGNIALNSNQFPSIDHRCDVTNLAENLQQIRVPSDLNLDKQSATGGTTTAKEWKREKTFDGCPIFSVSVNKRIEFVNCFYARNNKSFLDMSYCYFR